MRYLTCSECMCLLLCLSHGFAAVWNDQLSHCQPEFLTLSPYPRPRPHDGDTVLTDIRLSARPTAAPCPDAPSLTPPLSELLDRELEEAFQECEEQMASLEVLAPQTVNNLQEKTGAAMVKKTTESLPLPTIVDRPERSSRSLRNNSANGNSEAENTPRDAVVFSFRDYILGTASNAKTQEIQVTQNVNDCSEVKSEETTEKQEDPPLPNIAGSVKETQTGFLGTQQREVEDRVDFNEGYDKKVILDCNAVIKEEVIAIETGIGAMLESFRDDASTVCAVETVTNSNLKQGVLSGANLHSIDAKVTSEIQKEVHAFNREAQLSKMDTQRNLANDFELGARREEKTKGKKKKRRKKKTESKRDIKQKELETAAPSDNNLQASSFENAGKHSVIASGLEEPVFTPPLCSQAPRPDHLTHSACSPASGQHSLQMPDQAVDHNMSGSACGMNQCLAESPQKEQHAPVGSHIGASTVVTSVPVDSRPDVQSHEAAVTSGEASLSVEKQGPLSNSRICVGESGVEVALEEAFVAVAALPANTPTAPEVIKSEGSGESVRCDSRERVSTEAGGETGEQDLRVSDKRLGCTDRQTGGLLHSLSLIPPQENCTLAFSDAAGHVVTEEGCSSKMPHNSVESETKAGGETSTCGGETEPCTEEGAREKEQLRPEAFTDASPCGTLTGFYCDDQGAVGLERAAAQAREGGRERREKKGGRTLDRSLLGQLEGFPHEDSSAETETCLPSNVAESPLEPQCGSEPVPAIIECLAVKGDCLSQPCQKQCAAVAAVAPHLTSLEQSSTNAKKGLATALKSDVNSEEGLSLDGISEEGSGAGNEREDGQVILPSTASQQVTVNRQGGSVQQVPSESSTAESGTTEAASETQMLTQATSRSSPISEVGVHVCKSGGRSNNKVRFADTVKQEDGIVVSLKKMAGQTLDCASIAPLTVHENLHYPVVEESYTFPKCLTTKNPEDLNAATPAENESATHNLVDSTMLQKGSQFDEEDEVKRANINVDPDQSSNITEGILDLKFVKEASLNRYQGPVKEEQHDANQKHVVPQSFGTFDHILEKEKDSVMDKVADPSSKQTLVPLLAMDSTNVHEGKQDLKQLLSPCTELTPSDLNNVITEKLSEPLATDHINVTSTCTTPPTTKPIDPCCQSATPMDDLPFCGNTDLIEGTFDSSNLTKNESNSETISLDQPAPVIEQYATNSTSVPLSPQPMLSHLELITDSDVSLLKQNDGSSAYGGSIEVQDQHGKEMTLMSFTQEITHSRGSVEGDLNCLDKEYVIDTDDNCLKDIKIPFRQEGESSPVAVAAISVTGLDDVISQNPSESYSDGIKHAICESATTEKLVNSTFPLSLLLPSANVCDVNIKGSNEERQKDEKRDVSLKEQKGEVQDPAVGFPKAMGLNQLSEGTAPTSQQAHGSNKGALKEKELQPSPQLEDTESSMKDLNEDCTVSPDRKTIPPSDFQSSKVEFGSVSQNVYCPGLQRIHSATVEFSSVRETSQSAASGQSLPAPDPNNLARQQNQQQQCLSSSHPLEVSPGCCFEEGEQTKSQDRQTQEMFSENIAVAEAGDHFTAWRECQSAGSDKLMGDDSSGKVQVMCHEKADGKETWGPPEVQSTIVCLPQLNETLLSDTGEEMSCSHVGDTRQEMLVVSTLGFKQVSTFLSGLGGKGEQQSNILSVCQGQGEIPVPGRNTGVSVNSESQQHEISPFEITAISAANTVSCGIHEGAFLSTDQAQETHREISSLLPDPKSVESDSSAARALEGSSTESEKCEILHTLCEVLELRSSDVPSALQSNQGETAAIKGLGAGEVFREVAVVKEKEKKRNVLDFFESGDSRPSPETVDCHFLPQLAENCDFPDKPTPDAIAALPIVPSKNEQDLISSPPPVPAETEKLYDELHKPKDIAVETIDVCLVPQRTSFVKSSAEMSEVSGMVKSPAPGPLAQDAGSSWIKARKDAAVQSQSAQENTVDGSR